MDKLSAPSAYPRWLSLSLLLGLSTATACLVVYAADAILYAAPGYDQSWLLYAANLVLHGVTLYGPRVTETNPPLIVWFSTLPDLLADTLHASPVLMLRVFVTVMVLASAGWCARILRTAGLAATKPLRCFTFCAIAALLGSLSHVNFGQREQILATLVLPYLFYGASRTSPQCSVSERIALGIAAGIGFCFKPQEVLILVGFELFLLAWSLSLRSLLRAECFAAIGTIFIYTAVVYFATPYFRQTLPLLKDTYWAYEATPKLTILWSILFDPLLAAALLAWLALRKYLHCPAAPLALLAAGLGAGAASVLQGNDRMGWENHFFPYKVLLLCAIGWILLDVLGRRIVSALPRRPSVVNTTLVFIALMLPLAVRHEQRRLKRDRRYTSSLTKFFTQFPPGTVVYEFSTGLGGFTDVLKDHFVWGSRYAHLWMLPAIVENEVSLSGGPRPRKVLSPSRLQHLAEIQRSTTVEDLQHWKPQVVIVDRCDGIYRCQALANTPVNLLAWFLRSPSFAAEWSHYRLYTGKQQHKADSDRYDIYTRIP